MYRQVTFKLNLKGEETKIWKRKPKVTYSVALVMAFLAAENESRQLEDLPQADFGSVPERFLLSVRTNALTDNLTYWKSGTLHGFMVIQGMFSSWVRTHLRISFRDCRSFYFNSLIKIDLNA